MPPATSPTSESFLFLFRNGGPDTHAGLTAEQRIQLSQRWNDWYNGLAAAGHAQQGRPLGLTGRVVAGKRGEAVKDGPFAEAKEVVAGYIFLTARDLNEATELAKGCPGLELDLTVEVRPVADVSPVLEGVQGRPPPPQS